jgi:hypothetical protein
MTPRVIPGARHLPKDQALLFEADMAKNKKAKNSWTGGQGVLGTCSGE